MEVGSSKVKVNWAKYPKRLSNSRRSGFDGRRNKQFSQEKGWRYKEQQNRTRRTEESVQRVKSAKVIKIEKVIDNLEWLERSLTCCSGTPRDIDSLRLMINNAFKEKIVVRDLGKFKFLLTMDSKETKESLKDEAKEMLNQWFYSFDDWEEADVCQTRRLWLEIVGLPIQLWSETNIRKIAELWGDVVLVDNETSTMESFASAKVVIDTLCMSPIEDEAIIQVEDKGFTVFVFEAKTEFIIFHSGPLDGGSPDPSISKANGHLGTDAQVNQVNPNLGDSRVDGINGTTQDDGAQIQNNGDSGLDLNLNSNSNFSQDVGHPWDGCNKATEATGVVGGNRDECGDGLNEDWGATTLEMAPLINAEAEGVSPVINTTVSSSSSKTRTAPISSNGYSKELVMLNQLSHDKGRLNRANSLEEEISDTSIRPDLSPEMDHAPSGFERPVAACVNGGGNEMVEDSQRNSAGGRVTRSQLKKSMAPASRKQRTSARKICKKNNEQDFIGRKSMDSVETTESMKQLAEEALRVGALLGIKVTSHKANAIKGLTDSLKAKNEACSTRARR